MPRAQKRKMPVRRPKAKHYRCRSCGALVPQEYNCLCPESRLIAKILREFPGSREIKEGEQ